MQAELQKAEAASEVVEASAGGGMVTVKANGCRRGRLDHELLADLVLAAVNEVVRPHGRCLRPSVVFASLASDSEFTD